jgi:hypothetical protein
MAVDVEPRVVLITEVFGLGRTDDDDWFDAILDTDTKLFVDPFLVFKETTGFWSAAHGELIAHFNTCFQLIASSGANRDAVAYRQALALLTFPEPKEMCLGYTAHGVRGSGGGAGHAQVIASAIEDAIRRGLRDIRHFEELGILNEGIGPDRISDMACNILKPRFIEYTLHLAGRLQIPTEEHKVFPRAFEPERRSWTSGKVRLPTNPFTKGPLLFVPARFLRDLPTLNPDDWWNAYEAARVVRDLNYEIMGRVTKEIIVEEARRHEESVRTWMGEQESTSAKPYDLEKDSKGLYQWHASTGRYATAAPYRFDAPETVEAFDAIVSGVANHFKTFIEENGGWRLLWDDNGEEKHEEAAQLVFFGLARVYCRANGVEVDRETEMGRGPVDFKFSNGFAQRALLEVKKLHNGRFWDGLETQLPTYCNADSCGRGWLLAIQYRPEGISEKRGLELPARVAQLRRELGMALWYSLVDATPKKSASKI